VIERARAFRVGGSTPLEVTSARASFGERRGLLLALTCEHDVTTFGEASPLLGFSRETLDEVEKALAGVDWRRLQVPRDVAGLRASPSMVSQASLRFAIETALGSLAAERSGVSLGAWLSGRALEGPLPCSVLVGRLGAPESLLEAERALASGARSLKLKVSLAEAIHARDTLPAFRRAVGDAVELRVDFNGTLGDLSMKEMLDVLAAFDGHGVAFAEEPCSGAGLVALGALPLPWFADESLIDLRLQRALLEHPHIAGAVLKPTLLGGLIAAWDLAQGFLARGKGVVITHAFEGSVALAACAELALGLGSAARAPGLTAHAALPSFGLPVPPQIRSASASIAPALGATGLGLDAAPLLDNKQALFEWTR